MSHTDRLVLYLQSEFLVLNNTTSHHFKIQAILHENKIYTWQVIIQDLEGNLVHLGLEFTHEYPIEPPHIHILYSTMGISHIILNADGSMIKNIIWKDNYGRLGLANTLYKSIFSKTNSSNNTNEGSKTDIQQSKSLIQDIPLFWDEGKDPFSIIRLPEHDPCDNGRGSLNYREGVHVVNRFKESSPAGALVVRVYRIQNNFAWRAYNLRKQHMEYVRGRASEETRMFHGTRWEHLENIAVEGLNPRDARNGLLGGGIYFAKKSSTSHCYTAPNQKMERCMLSVRCLLGDIQVVSDYRHHMSLNRLTDEMGEVHLKDENIRIKKRYDSKKWAPSDIYCIFNAEQCLIDHIIIYTIPKITK